MADLRFTRVLALVLALASPPALAEVACDSAAIAVATTPVPMQRSPTLAKHFRLMEATHHPADVILLGDSLAEQWRQDLPPLSTFKTVNLGIGSDMTQNVLWRLNQMADNSLGPRLVIVLLGTNNLSAIPEPCGIVAGITSVVERAHGLWPEATVVFVAIPPRGMEFSDFDDRRQAVNAAMADFASRSAWLKYINVDDPLTCGLYGRNDYLEYFLSWFTYPAKRCSSYQSDGLHLTTDGYKIIGDAIAGVMPHG